jgi:hypothetical protein
MEAPASETPVVALTERRFSFNIISAASLRAGYRFMKARSMSARDANNLSVTRRA